MQSPPPLRWTNAYRMEDDDENQEITDIETSARLVEKILKYSFKNKKLLEEALTHPSYSGSASYQRLEFVGDSALGLAISNYAFITYPNLEPGKLSLIRAFNICTEKLARVAVRHQLYNFVRHNTTLLDDKVKEFVIAVQQEDEVEIYGGLIKAPKFLADIVESIAAAVYVDCDFNLKDMWEIFRHLLEPLITLDLLQQQPQPVTMLFELCQKNGKKIDIRHWKNGERNVASVYVDGNLLASASSEQKDNAKLHAAKTALKKMSYEPSVKKNDLIFQLNGEGEIEVAKHKLHDLCHKRKWSKPNYEIQKEAGHAHERKYICSVEIEIPESILFVKGDEKSRVKEAENSAASIMLRHLQESKHI